METLLQVAKDNGIEKIYYYDIAAIDFDKRKIKLVLPEGLLEL